MKSNGIDEIQALCDLLDISKIKYQKRRSDLERINQVEIIDGNIHLSAICHFGSYGYQAGLIECWNFDSTEEPAGWLTAEEAFQWMINHGAKS